MNAKDRLVSDAGRRRGAGRRLLPLACLGALALGGWGPSTYYDHRTGWVFDPAGTPLDCAVVAEQRAPGTYWRGLAGGHISLGIHEVRVISREACFDTLAACEYWRAQMDGALTRVTTSECAPR